mmetsp:Transcript_4973/g.11863  ORF Transcript_4973/g.11863 Transcript_4973/m.11863 type:complete len:219 (-) Transcript_4973:203-859(-)
MFEKIHFGIVQAPSLGGGCRVQDGTCPGGLSRFQGLIGDRREDFQLYQYLGRLAVGNSALDVVLRQFIVGSRRHDNHVVPGTFVDHNAGHSRGSFGSDNGISKVFDTHGFEIFQQIFSKQIGSDPAEHTHGCQPERGGGHRLVGPLSSTGGGKVGSHDRLAQSGDNWGVADQILVGASDHQNHILIVFHAGIESCGCVVKVVKLLLLLLLRGKPSRRL